MSERIIDRDIEEYQAYYEAHCFALRRCPPQHEPRARALRDASERVLKELKHYRAVIDAQVNIEHESKTE